MGQMVGGLMNRLGERAIGPEPEVGMGCTEFMYSDRHAYTVVEILSKPGTPVKRVVVTRDIATRIDNYGMSDAQDYEYTTDPNGIRRILRLNKWGQWKEEGSPDGSSYGMGRRDEYYDYTF
ncbi:MAG: hypothetical protein PHS57_06265 [Alphaproteobacteria bacterium]|nr:hypothetical protein [Alphaproteobacteria bacterium]